MQRFSTMRTLDLWYARFDVEAFTEAFRKQASAKALKTFDRNVAKARAKDSLRAFDKLTAMVDGQPRIISDPPLIVPVEDVADGMDATKVEESMRTVIRSYRRTLSGDRRRLLERFQYAHAARKVVGVGSVGTRAWIMLLLGHDEQDPLFLQAKEAEPSVLEPFLGRSEFATSGQRVVEGQRLMQASSDIMLGWLRVTGVDGVERDFYVRQLWDGKASATVEVMEPPTMTTYAEVCGWTLAKAHARSGDSVAIASYLGTSDSFDRSLATFAETYADQNERDYQVLVEAVKSGRVTAEEGL